MCSGSYLDIITNCTGVCRPNPNAKVIMGLHGRGAHWHSLHWSRAAQACLLSKLTPLTVES